MKLKMHENIEKINFIKIVFISLSKNRDFWEKKNYFMHFEKHFAFQNA